MDSGNVAFMFICTAMVVLMTPGLAFFYGGFVRRKNVCNTMMCCIAIMGLEIVLWALVGYSISFGEDHGGIIGGLNYLALNGVGMEIGPYSDSIPHLMFCAFQMAFAMITPALICGSLVGRIRFRAMFVFAGLWSLIVYCPMAHMVWGSGGLIAGLGAVDFAGGDVVHISSGISALTMAIILGQRRGYKVAAYRIHNIPFVVLGASLLWFGWFAFNAGSALEAGGLVSHVVMTTLIASGCALLSWMFIDTVREGHTTLVGACTGFIVGLVAITPGAGFVPIWSSFLIGALASPISYFGIRLVKQILKIDDSLDAFGCHGIGGLWGGIATGLFTQSSINSVAQWDGLIYGDYHLFVAQILGILITIVYSVVGTLVCTAIVRAVTPLRVTPREEMLGLDITQHGEVAYPAFNGMDQ